MGFDLPDAPIAYRDIVSGNAADENNIHSKLMVGI